MIWCPPALIYMVLIIALSCFYIAIGLYRGTFSTLNIFENVTWLSLQCCCIMMCCICLTCICAYSRTTAWISVTVLVLSAIASCLTVIGQIAVKEKVFNINQ